MMCRPADRLIGVSEILVGSEDDDFGDSEPGQVHHRIALASG